jgi:FkbM family methyltransferase
VKYVEDSKVLGGLKSRFIRACQYTADQIFAASAGAEWQSPPKYVCNRIACNLGIVSASTGELGGDPIVQLTTRGDVTFVGPSSEEKWNCSRARINFLRASMETPELLQSLSLSDAHFALLHNLIVRYATEFSAYPFHPCRTLNVVSGDTFLDIGAFRGYVSVKASLKVGMEGLVYAIEPMSENFAYVQAHRELNNLRNVECLQSAVSIEHGSDVQFYATENQANACVLDHLDGSHRELTVENLSAQSLAEKVLGRAPRRVIASITTNGTEMNLARSLAECFVEGKIGYLELTIPIIYTHAEVPAFLTSMGSLSTDSRLDYPWLTLIYRR